MKMRTFEAETMHEALSKVKMEMGEDAVIVKNRKVSRRSGGKLVDFFEVTAALEVDVEVSPRSPTLNTSIQPLPLTRSLATKPLNALPSKPATYDWKGGLPRVDEQGRSPNPVSVQAPASLAVDRPPASMPAMVKADAEKAQSKFMDMLRSEFKDVRESVEMPTRELRVLTDELRLAIAGAHARDPLTGSADTPTHLIHEHLLHCGFDRVEARRLLIAALANVPPDAAPTELCQALRKILVHEVRCTGGVRFARGRATRIAFVGPAGAGKTTTLLKLAAIAAIRTGRKVGLLAGDAVRLGSEAQLQAFGRTSGMPVVQVFGPEDLDKAAPHVAECELILLDTAGRAPLNGDEDADRQMALVRAFQPDETLLTLSALTRLRELENQCRRFQAYRPGSLVLTRLDECLEMGSLHALARRTGLPLGYLCDGPSIPEHIQTAKSHHIANLLLPEPTPSQSLSAVA